MSVRLSASVSVCVPVLHLVGSAVRRGEASDEHLDLLLEIFVTRVVGQRVARHSNDAETAHLVTVVIGLGKLSNGSKRVVHRIGVTNVRLERRQQARKRSGPDKPLLVAVCARRRRRRMRMTARRQAVEGSYHRR